jgi:nucleotide-binding universal stress UspA family protein
MYDHLLIATDGSEVANTAVEQGLVLAKKLGAKVTFVAVTEPVGANAVGEMDVNFDPTSVASINAKWATKVLARVTEAAKAAGVDYDALHVPEQHPAEGIIQAAKDRGCDVILMSSHGRRGISRLLLGSQTHNVVTMSPVPVLVCR